MTTAWLGPIKPYLIDTWPEMRLISRPWTKCGLTRPGPFSCRTIDSFSIPGRPPMPEPIDTPVRSRSVLAHVGQAGILERLAGGVDAVDDERVDLALDLVIDAHVGVEAIFVVGRLDFAGDAALLVAGVEPGDRSGARSCSPGCSSSWSRRRRRAASRGPDQSPRHGALLSLQSSPQTKRPPEWFGKPFVPHLRRYWAGGSGPNQPLFWSI